MVFLIIMGLLPHEDSDWLFLTLLRFLPSKYRWIAATFLSVKKMVAMIPTEVIESALRFF